MTKIELSAMEICAGAGGQSAGLEAAGFGHELAVEIDVDAANTLRLNRPHWNVQTGDVREVDGKNYKGIDLFAGGVPCPPFSIAGKQLGSDDERDLFPEALRLISETNPKAVMLENVRGLAGAKFADYRTQILDRLESLGYEHDWKLLNASSYGVPQLRPRFILVAMKPKYFKRFQWPEAHPTVPTVGATLGSLMAANDWQGAMAWASNANGIAPTVVGGSKKHGGADLGPTRSKQAWLQLGVDGKGVANEAPLSDTPIDHIPRLTNEMVARIQGFPNNWQFAGKKTSTYRQIGNAFPSPVARGIGDALRAAITGVSEEVEHEIDHWDYLKAV